jgi:PPOX class probable F420-dependent enzyme
VLEEPVRQLAQGANLAAVSTLLPDGRPMNHLMWVDADGDHLYVNTEVARQKYKNVRRDPRVTVLVMDASNPFHYVEVRGHVVEEVRGEEARAQLDRMSEKYTGRPYSNPIGSDRVLLKVAPDRQRVR